MRLGMIAISGVLLIIHGCGSSKHVIYPACSIEPVPYNAVTIDNQMKRKYLAAVNKARSVTRKCGNRIYVATEPLRWNESLYRAAYEHSYDMAKCAHFSHRGSGMESDWTGKHQSRGSSRFVERIENNGYTRHLSVAENIAYGMNDPDEVMQQWLASEGHCDNIMNPSFTEFGMARVKDASGRYYWTQTFGSQYP